MSTDGNFDQLVHELREKLGILEVLVEYDKPQGEIDKAGGEVDALFNKILEFSLITASDRSAAIRFAVSSLRLFTEGNRDIGCYLDLIERASATTLDTRDAVLSEPKTGR